MEIITPTDRLTFLISSAGVSEAERSSEDTPSKNTPTVHHTADSTRSSIAMKLIGRPTRGLSPQVFAKGKISCSSSKCTIDSLAQPSLPSLSQSSLQCFVYNIRDTCSIRKHCICP